MGFTPPFLDVRKVAGGWNVYAPTSTTGDTLQIFANTTDALPVIKLIGNGQMFFYSSGLRYHTGTVDVLKVSYTSPDAIIEGLTADKNIFLKTAGTGVLKFGTYTAGAATDSTGYITILDAAGNTRKLMVQA